MRKDFNAEYQTNKVIEWIQVNFKKVVIGVSGGKDSTIVAKLSVMALGKENVYGVLMPNGEQKDISDSLQLVEYLGINYEIVNINEAYSGLLNSIKYTSIDQQALTNVAPRLRMTTLYAIAQSRGARVIGTGNRSEGYVGYTSKWGDNASDGNPIADFDTEELMAIGDYLEIPYELVHKIPSDGLCGISDEQNLGFTYHQLNEYMDNGTCGDKEIDFKIFHKHQLSLHKSNPIPKYLKL